MAEILRSAVAVIGIDIGKTSFHVVALNMGFPATGTLKSPASGPARVQGDGPPK
jgi:hypothetical protein